MHKRDDSRSAKARDGQLLKLLSGAFALSLSLYLVASLVGGAAPSIPSEARHPKRAVASRSPSPPGRVEPDTPAGPPAPAPAPAPSLGRRATNPTAIPISLALPDAAGLSPQLAKTWDGALESLGSAAIRGAAKSAVVGIPGTRATTAAEARALQATLDCTSGKGEWVLDSEGAAREQSGRAGLTVHKHSSVLAACDKRFYGRRGDHANDGGWDVRESLKWRWVAAPACTQPGVAPPPPLTRRGLCSLLAHKSTLLVGDTLQYSLHDLILDWTSTEPQSCYGDLYCKEHALCGDILRANAPAAARGIEDWATDERVFHRLPPPPQTGAALAARAVHELSPALEMDAEAAVAGRLGKAKSISFGTMLRYRRSDGLQYSGAHTTPTFAHPATGVREVNQQWLADARRNDIVILTKPPLPLPLRGHNATWDAWWDSNSDRASERIVEAAWRITEDVWLPELLDTLKAMRAGRTDATNQLIVYRGGWRTHADCSSSSSAEQGEFTYWNSAGDGPPPHASQPTLRQLLFRTTTSTTLRDPHALFSTLQTILQNHAVRTALAPAFGLAFLDLETPLSVWRSGMLGGSASTPFQAGLVDQTGGGGTGKGLRNAASGDCQRYCVPSPGMAIEEAFLGGLMRILGKGE